MKLFGRSLQVCRVEACRECSGPSRIVDMLSEEPTECQYTNFYAKCCHCKMQNVATHLYTVFAEVSWYTWIRTYDDVKQSETLATHGSAELCFAIANEFFCKAPESKSCVRSFRAFWRSWTFHREGTAASAPCIPIRRLILSISINR